LSFFFILQISRFDWNFYDKMRKMLSKLGWVIVRFSWNSVAILLGVSYKLNQINKNLPSFWSIIYECRNEAKIIIFLWFYSVWVENIKIVKNQIVMIPTYTQKRRSQRMNVFFITNCSDLRHSKPHFKQISRKLKIINRHN
jgi:spermidine synthase